MEKNIKHALTSAMLLLIKLKAITQVEIDEATKQDYDGLCSLLDGKEQEIE